MSYWTILESVVNAGKGWKDCNAKENKKTLNKFKLLIFLRMIRVCVCVYMYVCVYICFQLKIKYLSLYIWFLCKFLVIWLTASPHHTGKMVPLYFCLVTFENYKTKLEIHGGWKPFLIQLYTYTLYHLAKCITQRRYLLHFCWLIFIWFLK